MKASRIRELDKPFIPKDQVDYTSKLVQPRWRNPASQQLKERSLAAQGTACPV